MKKFLCRFFVPVLLLALLASCSEAGQKKKASAGPTADSASFEEKGTASASFEEKTEENAGSGAQQSGAKAFTSPVRLDGYPVEFCLPEGHDGSLFTDLGVNCTVMIDRYGQDVAAYHEYDSQGETVKKTVGAYTFDYQKFHYLGIEDWLIYVIRIEHNTDYYRFLYNVYAKDYDDAQVEAFMRTIRFDT